ncbi:S-adenosyl-L-methionine-dependent methyltransferase [Irpex rosettiformis]|uniref:S-adenosyl-L-methionine-dependent methyltransferase n=1 Tax=Irpex rosettiformis TaxID=378272 RepID=A0ACB8U069_9APHY|nr:S-adenosyl-L-methionine-dependent methyltransferase [Irpex rosettiformis]
MSQEISQLLSLITSSAKAIEAEFIASDSPAVPSLNSTDTHPLDFKSLKSVRDQLRTLDAACAQLRATLAPPIFTVFDRAQTAICDRVSLEVALSCKIADLLRDKPEGVHIDELGKAAGVHPGKLGSILRYLATTHIFQEVKEGVFANNRLSIQLLEETPGSSIVQFRVSEANRGACALLDTLLDPVRGPSYDAKDAAICKMRNWPKTWFDWHAETEEGAKVAQLFGRAMTGLGKAMSVQAAVTDYPWAQLVTGSTVCDIGSGVGTVALELAKAHPGLKLILQDMPSVLKYAENVYWPKECPQALQEKRVEFKALDFFEESPVPGCDVYFMKSIMHDWNDERCITILKNIRKVMRPDSKVLFNEYLLRPAIPHSMSSSAIDIAPAPLLSNGGVGRSRLYGLDIVVLGLCNSRERFLREYADIAEQAGLKLNGVWDAGDANTLEFVVA